MTPVSASQDSQVGAGQSYSLGHLAVVGEAQRERRQVPVVATQPVVAKAPRPVSESIGDLLEVVAPLTEFNRQPRTAHSALIAFRTWPVTRPRLSSTGSRGCVTQTNFPLLKIDSHVSETVGDGTVGILALLQSTTPGGAICQQTSVGL